MVHLNPKICDAKMPSKGRHAVDSKTQTLSFVLSTFLLIWYCWPIHRIKPRQGPPESEVTVSKDSQNKMAETKVTWGAYSTPFLKIRRRNWRNGTAKWRQSMHRCKEVEFWNAKEGKPWNSHGDIKPVWLTPHWKTKEGHRESSGDEMGESCKKENICKGEKYRGPRQGIS